MDYLQIALVVLAVAGVWAVEVRSDQEQQVNN